MPSNTEPAAAALNTLDPQAQELAFLRACTQGQADKIKQLQSEAGKRCSNSRALKESSEVLSGDHARLLKMHAELNAKYTDTLEKLAKAQQRQLDTESSVTQQVVNWFAHGGASPTFASEHFPEKFRVQRSPPNLAVGALSVCSLLARVTNDI